MYFKRFWDEDLAQSSYLIGCQQDGTAIVIDARRDIEGYVRDAEGHGLQITVVAETHIHADYLSGSRELAAATDAKLSLSDEGDTDWKYGFGDEGLHDGDEIRLGNVRLEVLHTPGHTPEHICFLITDLATSEHPNMLISGDFVFVGDVGRPDLLDETAGFEDTRFSGAKDLFVSLRDRFLPLADHVQVWPGHGAGSACGKALGAVPSTTVGYERLSAWWVPFVLADDEEGFMAELLSGQPDAPTYFGRMKRLNKSGPEILGDRVGMRRWDPTELADRLGHDVILLDTRSADRFRADTIQGSLCVPAGPSFVTYASYAVDPDHDDRSVVVLAAHRNDADRIREKLSRVGIDRVAGFVDTLEGLPRNPIDAIDPSELEALDGAFVLDVRTKAEFEDDRIPGAVHIHVGRLSRRLADVPRDRPVVVHCQLGARAAVAEGILHAAGFENIIDLAGSFAKWKEAQTKTA